MKIAAFIFTVLAASLLLIGWFISEQERGQAMPIVGIMIFYGLGIPAAAFAAILWVLGGM